MPCCCQRSEWGELIVGDHWKATGTQIASGWYQGLQNSVYEPLKQCVYLYIHTLIGHFIRCTVLANCIALQCHQIDQNTVRIRLYVDDASLCFQKKKVQAFQAATKHVSGCLMFPTKRLICTFIKWPESPTQPQKKWRERERGRERALSFLSLQLPASLVISRETYVCQVTQERTPLHWSWVEKKKKEIRASTTLYGAHTETARRSRMKEEQVKSPTESCCRHFKDFDVIFSARSQRNKTCRKANVSLTLVSWYGQHAFLILCHLTLQPVGKNQNKPKILSNITHLDTEKLSLCFFFFSVFLSQQLQLSATSSLIAGPNIVFQGTFLSALMRT